MFSIIANNHRNLTSLFKAPLELEYGVFHCSELTANNLEYEQTIDAFSEKWEHWNNLGEESTQKQQIWESEQKKWYLSLYGYKDLQNFAESLQRCPVILDAGCGTGFKSQWIATLAPHSLVIGMDASTSIYNAASRFKTTKNLVFVRGDISNNSLCDSVIDFINCDQVLHHTTNPQSTLREFGRVSKASGKLNAYVYAKKALPRELLDDFFARNTKNFKLEEVWKLSEQLTTLGRLLHELNIEADFPDIPALGIKGGPQNLQRFIYWNFIKCFWNPNYGEEVSIATNFDWYAPNTSHKYSESEFRELFRRTGWQQEFIHSEPACWTGRFILQ